MKLISYGGSIVHVPSGRRTVVSEDDAGTFRWVAKCGALADVGIGDTTAEALIASRRVRPRHCWG